MDKSKLKGFIDENNSVKSNVKIFLKLVNIIQNKNSNEMIKEDDLSKLIYLKILLKKQIKSEEVRRNFEIPDISWRDLCP